MTREAERADLHKTIWRIANDLRGSVDGWDFKQHVLGCCSTASSRKTLLPTSTSTSVRPESAFDHASLEDEAAEFGRAETVAEKGFHILPSELFVNVRRAARNDET